MPRLSPLSGAGVAMRALTDLALPVTCAGCGRPDDVVCPVCSAEIGDFLWPAGPLPVRPRPEPLGLPMVHSAGPYAGALAAVVRAYKDDGRRDCAPMLGRLLADSLDAALAACPDALALLRRRDGPVLVVPVPSSSAARRRRGDAPLVALADRALAGFAPDEAVRADALRPRRRVADQAGLGARARALNLEQSMAVLPRWATTVRGSACVVVDDVLTTGATLVESARALRAGGAGAVVAATICATQRRSGGGARPLHDLPHRAPRHARPGPS